MSRYVILALACLQLCVCIGKFTVYSWHIRSYVPHSATHEADQHLSTSLQTGNASPKNSYGTARPIASGNQLLSVEQGQGKWGGVCARGILWLLLRVWSGHWWAGASGVPKWLGIRRQRTRTDRCLRLSAPCLMSRRNTNHRTWVFDDLNLNLMIWFT